MKQSVDLMNSMKRFSFRHSNSGTYSTRRTYSTAPTSLARWALLLLSVFLLSFGSAWGQTFKPAALPTSNVYEDVAVADGTICKIHLNDHATQIMQDLSYNLKYARWFIADAENNNVDCSASGWSFAPYDNNGWTTGIKEGEYGYVYWDKSYTQVGDNSGLRDVLNMQITAPSESDWSGKKIIAVFSDETNASPTEPTLKTMYVFEVKDPSELSFTRGTEPSSETVINIDNTSSAYNLDLYTNYMSTIVSALGNNLYHFYCRWYLRDASTKEVVDMATSPFSFTASSGDYNSYYAYLANQGLIWNSELITTDGKGLSWSSGYQIDDVRQLALGGVTWDNPDASYEVVCVMSANGPTMKSATEIWKEPTFQLKYVFHMDAPDNFESELKAGATGDGEYAATVQDPANNTAMELDLSKATASCANPIYARFQVLCDDVAVDLESESSLLTITGTGITAKLPKDGTLGYYVYNAGLALPADLTVTLNAAALSFPHYKVVCILSSGAEGDEFAYDSENGKVTQEPNWDVKYTYSFQNDVAEYPVTLTLSEANVADLTYDKSSEAQAFFGKESTTMWNTWYENWYLCDTDGNKQPVSLGTAAGDGWVVSLYCSSGSWSKEDDLFTISGNVISTNGSKLDYEYRFANMFAKFKLFAPTGTKIKDYSGYKIVLELNDANDSDIKLRYIFNFPTIGEFVGEAKTGAVTTSGTQRVTRTDSSVAVDLTTMALAEAKVSGDIKYARFYLTDVQGNAIDPTGLLTVQYNGSAATACDVVENGFYIYQNGSALTKANISVSLAAPKRYTAYKVVALFSTDETNILTADGIVYEEPDYDLKYTYTFDYTITTNDVAKQVDWDAAAMEADASAATDIDTDWKTSLAELATGQCIKWYVTDGSSNVQPLAIGTERQSGTWTIALPTGFVVDGNVALLNGKKTIEPEQFASWVATNVYAPSEATYAEVSNHKIVFEIYTNDAGTAPPNARYTFSIHKGFVGTLKSGKTATTVRLNPTSGATTFTFNATIPSGTRHSRFYLTNLNDTPIDYTIADMNAQYSTPVSNTVEDYNISLGTYRYATNPIGPATEQITLTLSTATLDQYKVVVVTSGDAAVFSDDVMTSEPDWDTKTTYWFKYPAAGWSPEANVEWSAQSMQITAPDIETNKGVDYLDNNKSHYTMQWQVVDKFGNAQYLRQGSNRANDYWTFSINGDPFALKDNNTLLTVTNDDKLSSTTFANWVVPVVFAPKNMTMREVAEQGIRFVCKFYEDDQTPLTDDLCAMTYTVYIDKQDPHALLKDGGQRGGETISEGLTAETTSLKLNLTHATTAFQAAIGKAATYARIYLTKSDGTIVDPTTALTGTTGTAFSDVKYGYYLYNTEGITLPSDAILQLEAGKYSFYNVIIAMSGDTDEQGHTHDLAPRRAADVRETYEPDYDYIYTIKFAETSTFPGTVAASAFTHSKEILVANDEVATVDIPLAENINKIKKEFGAATFVALANNLHIRWYLTKKGEDGSFDKIPGSENYLTATGGTYWNHRTEADYGLYWNSATSTLPGNESDAANVMNISITKNPGGSVPALTGSWEDYQLVIVMSNDLTGQMTTGSGTYDDPLMLTHEPDNLNMVYTYSFFKEAAFLFVHDKGASERPYHTQADFADVVQQYNWNNSNSTRENVNEKIRQGVHTVEYDIYVDPTSSTPINLKLPFENYYGDGDVLEPAAYIRWYDWMTDINSTRLAIADAENTMLEDMTETNQGASVSRGLFMLNNSVAAIKPIHKNVGVTFNPAGLNSLVTIACDVSKYYDGIYTGSADDDRPGFSGKKKPYLMHEPTLSTRYIFNIRPASVIATDIQIGQDKLEAGGKDMFQLAEDNGRVSVAMKNASTEFSIRANLSQLDYYYINNGTTPLKCSKIEWYAYFEDETGIYRNDTKLAVTALSGSSETNRISLLTVGALNGTYNAISGGASKSITATYGQRYHLVGYIGDGSVMAPVVHYEVNLIEAPGYAVDDLPLERTEAYLRQHMTLQATVDFDGLCGTELSADLSEQGKNHSTEPLPWDEAQYGFCYPDVRRIYVSNDDMVGISPLHGDYMLLRSMNKTFTPVDYKYHWWDGTLLYDYTYNYGLQDKGKYGSFLYVDASDESRTIAQMKFDANLCAGSELCFTGVVANMTSGQVNPQVMATVYALKGNGERTRVVSFHSSNLSTMVNGTYTNGTWYQMYGRVAIPANVDLTGVTSYEVDIDNYSPGTKGADYAVDQLQFYTSNAKLKVKQQDVECGVEKVVINVYVDAEALSSKMGKNIYWRLCDSNGAPLTDPSLYDETTTLYGTTAVPNTVPEPTPSESEFVASSSTSGFFTGTDGLLYFSLAKKGFALEQGEQYYVSVYSMGETTVTDEALWGRNTDACDVYSPIFVPKMMYLEMQNSSGEVVATVDGSCSTGEATVNLKVVLQMPDDDEILGFRPYDDIHFDFFKGTLAEFNAYKITVGSDDYYLSDALKHYRNKENVSHSDAYKTATNLVPSYESLNPQYYAVINQAISEGLLFLSCSNSYNGTISSATPSIAALPIEDVVNNGKQNFHICSPLEYNFTINTTSNAPTLVLGFEDVSTYPADVRVVRVGKEQLLNMQKNDGGYLLHIPVNTFKVNDGAAAKTGTLNIVGDLDLLKYALSDAYQTTDSKITANVSKVATFEATTISSSQMYISVNFHGADVEKPDFKEGFAYRMFFQIKDAADANACEGNVEFLLKVVPEFVTWNGTTAEWNSDANWQRSERAELYKGEVTDAATADNHATAGHPNGYKNNSEQNINTTPKTYVPMKFTYVTIPSGLKAPHLVNLAYNTEGIYSNVGTGATTNIQYDLMVRYTEHTCQDHSISGDVYDCEKFYGNWAKELYMKPAAELLNQQWLTYEKVWVEKELTSNTWTLMSTPLQNTYAGDMYVPYSTTEAVNGRQITEAFQPISFSTTADAAGFAYSRTKYPIYQKGWTQQGVYVYTKTNDVRATKYSANIPGGVSTILNQWSHSYNDVTVPYSTWTAFAIRPHKKDQTAKTLIRLPKADTSYDYYQWDNTSPSDGKLTQDVSKATTGKLLTDGTPDISGVTYGTQYGSTSRSAGNGTYNALIADIQSSPSAYQLVGNPYLCSINMATFLSENSDNLETGTGYWTYNDNNTGSPITTGSIAPMQSFFVKAKEGATQITFTPSMMIDGYNVTSTPAPAVGVLQLTAKNDAGSSIASIMLGGGQAVETLFDSNLADVPMVYTVADGTAVSINHVPEIQLVPFGVVCKEDDAVNVVLSGVNLVNGNILVVDAVDGTTQTVTEGMTVSVVPNEYGRYFLIGGGTTDIANNRQLAGGVLIRSYGGVVTISADEALGIVRVQSVDGATVYSATNCQKQVQFSLQQGVYLILTDGDAGRSKTKVLVR